MDNLALIESFGDFKDDKNIDRITLMAILEETLKSVLKKKYGTDDNFDIIVNPDKGDLEIWHNRIVVEDGFSEDDATDIELSEARKIEPDFEVGEEVSEKIPIEALGRRAILTLRQTLVSKVMEHDNSNLYEKFKGLIGEVVSGEIHYVRHKQVIIMDDEQNEMILPKENQIPSDFFRKGDTLRAVVDDVKLRGAKPQIILSRTSPKFLEKLFEQEIPEQEIPEILDGLITIKNVVRIPGDKAKVAVESYDDRIDPVGACVGMKGSRIHSIVRELRNENIDVINYTNNMSLFIQRALSPAKISNIEINEEENKALVYVNADEVSKELSEFSDEIDAWVIEAFSAIGLDTAKSILEQDVDDLIKRTDLEEETILDVIRVLKEEFED